MKNLLLIIAIFSMFVSCSKNLGTADDATDSSDYSDSMQSNDMNQTGSNTMQPSDWEITANVKKTLNMDGSLSSNAKMISVETNDGVVTLTGSVASKQEALKVVKMVQGLSGVKGVKNKLNVSKS